MLYVLGRGEACSATSANNEDDNIISIYLDTCASITVLHDRRLLSRLRPVEPLHIDGVNGDGPPILASVWGDSPFGMGYFCENARLNLLSFGNLIDLKYDISYLPDVDEFWIRKVDLSMLGGPSLYTVKFVRHADEDNLYRCDIKLANLHTRTAASARQLRRAYDSHTGLDTVQQRRSRYTARELRGADEAVRVMRSLFFITPGELIRLLAKGSPGVSSLGITVHDVVRAVHINGPDLGRLKGTRTARKPPIIERDESISQWVERDVEMNADILFVNDEPFFLALFSPIDFPFVTELASRSTRDIMGAIVKARATVQKYGPRVSRMLIDRESATLSETVIQACADLRSGGGPLIVENAGGSSIACVERLVRTTKERCRASMNTLPYRMPKILIKWLVKAAVRALGSVPKKSAVDGRSGRERLTGRGLDGTIDAKFVFGAYVQTNPNETSNNMTGRTRAAIALMPTGNARGSWFFLSIETWRVFVAESGTALSVPSAVVQIINQKADQDFGPGKQKLKIGTWKTAYVNFDSDQEDGSREREYQEILELVPQQVQRQQVRDEGELDDDEVESQASDDGASSGAESNLTDDSDEVWWDAEELRRLTIDDVFDPADDSEDEGDDPPMEAAAGGGLEVAEDLVEDSRAPTADGEQHATANMTAARISNRKKRRPASTVQSKTVRSPRKRAHARRASAHISAFRFHVGVSARRFRRGAFNLTVKKALETLGDEAVKSIALEISQLYNRGTFAPADPDKLTVEQARQIISSSCFLKEKFTPQGVFEKLKARLVAGGHLQDRSVFAEGSTESPTASTTSVFLVAGIAASEGRAVASVDFPGAYLHADLPEDGPEVLMRLNRYEASVLIKLAPEFEKYQDKNKGTLVVRLKKGLYGLVQSARLWYEHLKADLMALGYTTNPHDECVFNKTESDGTQSTILVHVDDLLITSKTEENIDELLRQLGMKYKDLSVHRGRELDYLGMHFDWRQPGKCYVTMSGYIEELLTFAAEIKGKASTPASQSLFEIDEESEALCDERREFFHSLTAKFLYLAKRARPDLLLAVSFLARRVQKPTKEDMKKLQRVVRYLRANNKEGMCLQPDTVLQAYGWVDASFAVHHDMRSHTGAVLGLGKGPFWAKSSVQKLNSKSSTEAELIGASDSAGQLLWTRQFLVAQGYDVGPAVLYQDNQSTIALLNNGRSNSERTRHIAIRYFFLHDRINRKEVRVEYLCTGDMIADILTKPLQGEQFNRLRAMLLNWP